MAQKTIQQLVAQTDVQPNDLLVIQRGSNPLARILASTLGAYVATLVTGVLRAANNLSDLGSAATARGNLGLGPLATAADVPTALGYSPVKAGYTGQIGTHVMGLGWNGSQAVIDVDGGGADVLVQPALSYTPANRAGDSFSGPVSATSFVGPLTGNASTATAGQAGFGVGGLTAARVALGTAANSGRISWGTAAPGTLAVGEIYLQVGAV